jgi:hypothetical protein
MQLRIPDDTYAPYEAFAEGTQQSPSELITRQLDRFAKIHPLKRAVVIGAADIERLEAAVGGGSLKSGKDLADKVDRLASIRFHGIRLDFTPGQLEELAHMAERQGVSVEALATRIIREMESQFFWHTGGQAADRPTQSATPVVDQVPA